MLARDLTDEDIGRVYWVPVADVWQRVRFLGRTRRVNPLPDGGYPGYIVLWCEPTQPGQVLPRFKKADGSVFSGVAVSSSAEIHPVQIEYAVSADGEILEIGESAV